MKYYSYLKPIFIAGCSVISLAGMSMPEAKIISKLEIYNIETCERKTVKEFTSVIEAPNWTKDGKYLVYNSGGKIYKIDIENPDVDKMVDSRFAVRCNNDHVLSASGDKIAVSHHTAEDKKSRIYILPLAGGTPTLITPMGPSYLHGWSPDEKTLVYCADRNGNFDVYAIPAEGGEEVRLTATEGLDDGPEFSPCGHYIWFNSVRTGRMQVWRMSVDGSNPTQMTFDEDRNAWFPHVSPDGKQVVFIAYKAGDVTPSDHPPGKNVELRLMSAEGGEVRILVELFGGQGTLNVNSWSPDSKQFAFVSYVE
jgi:Tol biopolymer transport system component